jgi:hypothetical protein
MDSSRGYILKNLILTGLFVVISVFGVGMASTHTAYAAVDPACDKSSAFFGFPVWYKYLDVGLDKNDPCAIKGPSNDKGFDWSKAVPRIGLAVVEILLRIAGLVAVGFTIYGGFRYMTSQGEPENLKRAQGTIINALVGLVIAMLATGIVTFLGSILWK